MRSLRPEIADHHSKTRSDLVLHIQVPGLDVGVIEVVIHRGWGQSNGGGGAQRITEGRSQAWIGSRRGKASGVSQRGIRRRSGYQVRHRLIGEDGIARADRCPSVSEWIPCEPDTRLECMI